MDFDIIDDVKPRFQLQSGTQDSDADDKEVNKYLVAICSSIGVILLGLAWFQTGVLQFLSVWLALSLVVGPFAPSFITGGNCRVGIGELLPEVETVEDAPAEPERKFRGRRSDSDFVRVPPRESLIVAPRISERQVTEKQVNGVSSDRNLKDGAEKEWTGEEIDLLRKQLVKFPRGTAQRWEVISEAFGGSHGLENVIKMSKLLGEKKFTDGDSYAKFLSQRKGGDKGIDSPLSQRWDFNVADESNKDKTDWRESDDMALVLALKTFPKDTPMRWDKVAVAVPGRSKAQCFKRFSELREGFRSARTDNSSANSDQGFE